MHNIEWLYTLKKDVRIFMNNMKGQFKEGYYRYSYSGDLLNETTDWGLGNAVFAAKALYTINSLDDINGEKDSLTAFIKRFQQPDGSLYDPVISKRAILRDLAGMVKGFRNPITLMRERHRAETRQAISAIMMMERRDFLSYKAMQTDPQESIAFLKRLNWSNPWGAGSHASHLLFFLNARNRLCPESDVQETIKAVVRWLSTIQSSNDGTWYHGKEPELRIRINGAMKVISGLRAAGLSHIDHAQKLIDTTLEAVDSECACDDLNMVYVITHAGDSLGHTYRTGDIHHFLNAVLNRCHSRYFTEIGGFSFYPGKSNDLYYGARISQGLPEPDIHGTCLYLWGIAMIARILGIEEEIGFREFIT